MSAHGRFVADRLRRYRDYTGESPQFASENILLNGQAPIKSVRGPQAQLESFIFEELADLRLWRKHPFGVSRARPTADGRLILFVDPYMSGFGRRHSAGEIILRRICPCSGSDGSFISGIPGLRIKAISSRNIELTLLDSDSAVILRSSQGFNWHDSVQTVESGAQELHLLWRERNFASGEREFKSWHAKYLGHLDWIGSALLRRCGIFQSATNAYHIKGWACDARFKFELTSTVDTGSYHDDFVSRITDPVWGIPLITQTRECSCNARTPRSRICWIELEEQEGSDAVLQLRFSHDEHKSYLTDLRPEFASIGASEQWISRTIPSGTASKRAL